MMTMDEFREGQKQLEKKLDGIRHATSSLDMQLFKANKKLEEAQRNVDNIKIQSDALSQMRQRLEQEKKAVSQEFSQQWLERLFSDFDAFIDVFESAYLVRDGERFVHEQIDDRLREISNASALIQVLLETFKKKFTSASIQFSYESKEELWGVVPIYEGGEIVGEDVKEDWVTVVNIYVDNERYERYKNCHYSEVPWVLQGLYKQYKEKLQLESSVVPAKPGKKVKI